jgi:hypothetical protein
MLIIDQDNAGRRLLSPASSLSRRQALSATANLSALVQFDTKLKTLSSSLGRIRAKVERSISLKQADDERALLKKAKDLELHS